MTRYADLQFDESELRYYIESNSARSAVNQAPKWKEGNESNEVTQ